MDPNRIYYLHFETKKRNTAGSKAPSDIAEICRRAGFRKLSMPLFHGTTGTLRQKIWLFGVGGFFWCKNALTVPAHSIVIYQHPSYGMRMSWVFLQQMKRKKKCSLIALVHDLESLRGGIKDITPDVSRTNRIGDRDFLTLFDIVICHNEQMRQYLIREGFQPERLVSLRIFDYLTTDCDRAQPQKSNCPSIAIAGNLAPEKSGYIYHIFDKENNRNLTVNLYGKGYRSIDDRRMIYHGSFSPDELPQHLNSDFGLVWDGPEPETCTGNTGEYLRFNNPHKASLYLASGMPVVIWDKAALADFILQQGVGITISSLYDLEHAIEAVSQKEYNNMCTKAKDLAVRLHKGEFFLSALQIAEAQLQQVNGESEV